MSKNLNSCSRRTFISQSFSGLASLGFVGASPKILSSKNPENKKIIYRQLGKTGIKVPVVSMGVYTTDPALIQAAFEAGVRLFSTAPTYQGGLCEKAIGDAVQNLGVRKDVFLATKIHTGRRRNGTWQQNIKELYLEKFSSSLERLQTDYLDIIYLYNVGSVEEITKPEILELLTELKQQKKTRYVGFTTHANHQELLNKASEMNVYDAVVVSFNYTMSENKDLKIALENAAKKGIGLVAMKTQCGGAWSVDGYRKPAEELKNQTAMLKWVLNNNFISTAIPAMESFQTLNEDFSVACDLEYTAAEKRFLDDENVQNSMAFCQQCQKCLTTCPQGVDIPALMRTHMYAFQYKNMDLVHLTERDSNVRDNISQCGSCKDCQAVCSNSVPIAHNIASLRKLNLNYSG